jgi:hypothetical protein
LDIGYFNVVCYINNSVYTINRLLKRRIHFSGDASIVLLKQHAAGMGGREYAEAQSFIWRKLPYNLPLFMLFFKKFAGFD